MCGPREASSSASFTVNGMGNGYSGNGQSRLILGPTFKDAPASDGCMWHNFGADSDPQNAANNWVQAENKGYFYLR
ncbi:MAG: hypothetical protein HY744_31600 [Deltaproteobacteria bacterium]|nr:hypothetical protein [Deltaproteobacteria bacterium]